MRGHEEAGTSAACDCTEASKPSASLPSRQAAARSGYDFVALGQKHVKREATQATAHSSSHRVKKSPMARQAVKGKAAPHLRTVLRW